MIYPILEEQIQEMRGKVFISAVTVMDLNSGKTWQPRPGLERGNIEAQFVPIWLSKLGVVLAPMPENVISLYAADGNLLKTYEGILLGVSPSGTKLLVLQPKPGIDGNSSWIDLTSERKVEFPWQRTPTGYGTLVWSDDEMQVYTSYHLYGNAQTGESFEMPGTLLDGKETGFIFDHNGGMWVLGGKYLLPSFHPTLDGAPGFLAVLDPSEKTYINVSERAGIPFELDDMAGFHACYYAAPVSAPGGRYVWVDCDAGGWLIDLDTFKAQHYPDYPEAHLDWSADGTFAWIKRPEDSTAQILSVNSTDLQPMPADADCTVWHPGKNIFSYLSHGGQTLSIFDVERMIVQKTVDLPAAFSCAAWNDTADKLILIDMENKRWQVNYPALDNLQEIGQRGPDFPGGIWSPDGTKIAYREGADIYIVDVNPNSPK